MTFGEKIASGRFVVCGELGPPQGASGEAIRKKARYFQGVDGVNITDNQTAIVRLSSIAAAHLLLEEGLEPIIQMTCRDRNRIAIQSDLLGAYALGIRNVLCLTGDYPSFGNHPEARPVYDLDAIQLVAMVAQMNAGFFLSGEAIKHPPCFVIGAVENPFAEPFEMRILRLTKKIRAGAQFIQTQAVFDVPRFASFMARVCEEGLDREAAILAGIMPVRSAQVLKHMRDEVPGVRIAPEYIARLEAASDPQEEGIRIAVEIIRAVREIPGVRGIHLMPVMWESITPIVLKEAGLPLPS